MAASRAGMSSSSRNPETSGRFSFGAGKQAAEALGEDLRLAVAHARLETQDQAGCLGSVVTQGLRRGDPDLLSGCQ